MKLVSAFLYTPTLIASTTTSTATNTGRMRGSSDAEAGATDRLLAYKKKGYGYHEESSSSSEEEAYHHYPKYSNEKSMGGKKGKKGKKGVRKGKRGPSGCDDVVKLEVPFIQGPPFFFVNSNDNTGLEALFDLGVQYLYRSDLFNEHENKTEGFVTGSCIRFAIAGNETETGGGACSFTYYDEEENTITASGDLFDLEGGHLAINGGTKEFQGAFGQVALEPLYFDNATTFDVFVDAVAYTGILQIKLKKYCGYHEPTSRPTDPQKPTQAPAQGQPTSASTPAPTSASTPASTSVSTPTPTPSPTTQAPAQGGISVLDIVVDSDIHTTLETAVLAASPAIAEFLGDPMATLTLFAPDDGAFDALPDGTIELLISEPWQPHLDCVLLGHVYPEAAVPSSAITEPLTVESAQDGYDLNLDGDGTDVTVNGFAVAAADINADNGIIHSLSDGVLLPECVTKNIVEVLSGDDDFSTLVNLVVIAGLGDALSGDPTVEGLTVMAPNNDAFAAVPEAVLIYLAGNVTALIEVLTYHVVPANVIPTESGSLPTLNPNGDEIELVVVSMDFIILNDSSEVEGTELASNGIIHEIDAVLVPPSLYLP